MATKILPNSAPPFSRLTESRGASSSWRVAIPIVLVAVAVVAALAYLASQLTTSSEKLAAAQRDSEASKQSVDGFQKQTSQLQADNALLRTAGRTTLMLEAAKPATKSKKKTTDAAEPSAGWAAATWGEAADGKTWMRVSAYGLQAPANGKAYHLWFTPTTGAQIDAGRLEPAADGSAFAMMKDLPAVDQGKSVALALNEEGAKASGEPLMAAQLPTLKATVAAPKAAAPAQTAPAAGAGAPAGATSPAGAVAPPGAATPAAEAPAVVPGKDEPAPTKP